LESSQEISHHGAAIKIVSTSSYACKYIMENTGSRNLVSIKISAVNNAAAIINLKFMKISNGKEESIDLIICRYRRQQA
jgi:hypothetical protein